MVLIFHRISLLDLLDEMLDDPHETFVTSNSKHCALISLKDGTTLFIQGDFSGTPEECEAEVRRILNELNQSSRRRANGKFHHR